MKLRVLVVDGANVVGSRPDGWWKDRAAAARRLHDQLAVSDLSYDLIVLVLEGAAKAGVAAGLDHDVATVHAPGDGDSTIASEARTAAARGDAVTVVTADRLLQAAVHSVGATTRSPSWLLDLLGR